MDLKTEETGIECNGRIYRLSEQHWIGKDGTVNYKSTYRLRKRLSCPGCELCECIDVFLSQVDPEFLPVIQDSLLTNGDYYKLVVNDVGHGDEGELIFIPVNIYTFQER